MNSSNPHLGPGGPQAPGVDFLEEIQRGMKALEPVARELRRLDQEIHREFQRMALIFGETQAQGMIEQMLETLSSEDPR